jgi:hypothetical protein
VADTLHDRIDDQLIHAGVRFRRNDQPFALALVTALRAINDRHLPTDLNSDYCKCGGFYPCDDMFDVAAAVGIEVN